MIGLTNAQQAQWAVGRLLLCISTSLQVQPVSPSRCSCPCMILRFALRSHLGAGNRDKEAHTARECSPPASLTKSRMYAGSCSDWGKVLCRGYATLTPHLYRQWLAARLQTGQPCLFTLHSNTTCCCCTFKWWEKNRRRHRRCFSALKKPGLKNVGLRIVKHWWQICMAFQIYSKQ